MTTPSVETPPKAVPQYVDIRTAADRLGVHPETLRRWDRNGTLTANRLPNGHRRYLNSEITAILQGKNS